MPSSLVELNREVIACTRCPRLVEYRERIAREKRRAYRDCEYWGKPVPGFGDPAARVLVLGLAPGAHGSNRTGRPFTGDASGKFMYPILYEAGFSNQPNADARDDGLELRDLYITAAVRCAPPDNKPLPQELANCASFLDREMDGLKSEGCGGPGPNRIRSLPQLPQAPGPAPQQESLPVRPRSQLQDARWQDFARFLSSFEPEHSDREADSPDVRQDFRRSGTNGGCPGYPAALKRVIELTDDYVMYLIMVNERNGFRGAFFSRLLDSLADSQPQLPGAASPNVRCPARHPGQQLPGGGSLQPEFRRRAAHFQLHSFLRQQGLELHLHPGMARPRR